MNIYNMYKYLLTIKIGFWITFLLAIFTGLLPYSLDRVVIIIHILSLMFLGIGYSHVKPYLLFCYPLFLVFYQVFTDKNNESIYIQIILYLIQIIVYGLILFLSISLMKMIDKLKGKYIDTTKALVKALDSRDRYTKNHSENVANYAYLIATKMKLNQELCEQVYIGGLLHDIGKIGIPEDILLKPGKLTDEEFGIIKRHPIIGYEMIQHIEYFRNSGILDIVLYHHERYDGKGYPLGLEGDNIPLLARIVAVADSFDAMNSKRNYRNKLSLEDIISEMKNNKGKQFDPKIVDIFLPIIQSSDFEELISSTKKSR